jgi:hypothetical protein
MCELVLLLCLVYFRFLTLCFRLRLVKLVKTRGVSHCGLTIYIFKNLKAKEEL